MTTSKRDDASDMHTVLPTSARSLSVVSMACEQLKPPYGRTKTRRAAVVGMASAIVTGLLGCATFYSEFEAFQTGWRTADVVEVGTAAQIQRTALTDCRKSATAKELAARKFAVVSYRAASREHVHIVLLEDASRIRSGDRVYANVRECGAPVKVLSRETKIAGRSRPDSGSV